MELEKATQMLKVREGDLGGEMVVLMVVEAVEITPPVQEIPAHRMETFDILVPWDRGAEMLKTMLPAVKAGPRSKLLPPTISR